MTLQFEVRSVDPKAWFLTIVPEHTCMALPDRQFGKGGPQAISKGKHSIIFDVEERPEMLKALQRNLSELTWNEKNCL